MSAAEEIVVLAAEQPIGAAAFGAATADEAQDAVDVSYWQPRILVSTIIGYAMYYFVRKNITVAMPEMEASGISKVQLGTFLSVHGVLYGVSKFTNGMIGDRVHIAYRFEGVEDGEPYVVEQHLCCVLAGDVIEHADLLCSGFRPRDRD